MAVFFSGNASSLLIIWPATEGVLTQCVFFVSLLCSAYQVDVIVDLRPLKNDGVVIRDVTLLLKCAKSVNWVVKTHNVMGKLVVVVSWHQNNKYINFTAAKKIKIHSKNVHHKNNFIMNLSNREVL